MITLAGLVSYLDERIPFAWAEEWDRVGLLAGDPASAVERVLVALDPSLEALARAEAAGADVLLTHHPAFLDPLETVVAGGRGGPGVVHEAVRAGVALLNCHTNLDRAPQGADSLPELLGLETAEPLEEPGPDVLRPRAGRICPAPPGATLGSLAALVGGRLEVRTTVWGPAEAPVRRIGIAPGSGRSLVPAARAAGCDVLLTGELRYHEALAALESGMCVIEAGHDATEWPLTRALAELARTAPGIAPDAVMTDDRPYPWWTA